MLKFTSDRTGSQNIASMNLEEGMEVLVCCLKNADLTNGKTENNYITELSDIKREARLQQGGCIYIF